MRYLGIDYGSKRVGIALSDESGKVAMPHAVIANSKKLSDEISDIICKNDVAAVIIGESKDFKGNDNAIMENIRSFKGRLENILGLPVIFEPEFLSSHQAQSIQGKNDMLDASAAAIILQSYLDRINQ